jgi:hypothetical protein
VTFARGLGVHAVSDLRYTLPAGTCSFLAVIGVDDEVGTRGSVTFQVLANGASLYTSPLLTGTSASPSLNLPLPAGSTQLQLLVANGGDNTKRDHADWADARFSCTSGGAAATAGFSAARALEAADSIG